MLTLSNTFPKQYENRCVSTKWNTKPGPLWLERTHFPNHYSKLATNSGPRHRCTWHVLNNCILNTHPRQFINKRAHPGTRKSTNETEYHRDLHLVKSVDEKQNFPSVHMNSGKGKRVKLRQNPYSLERHGNNNSNVIVCVRGRKGKLNGTYSVLIRCVAAQNAGTCVCIHLYFASIQSQYRRHIEICKINIYLIHPPPPSLLLYFGPHSQHHFTALWPFHSPTPEEHTRFRSYIYILWHRIFATFITIPPSLYTHSYFCLYLEARCKWQAR